MIDHEVIIHIGFHKTGTSSIQDTLAGYQTNDLCYIDLGAPNHSILLAHAFRKDLTKNTGFVDSDRYRKQAAMRGIAVRDALQRQLSEPKSRRSLISAEVLSQRTASDIVDGLLNVVNRQCLSYRTIAYVRPPYDYIQSMWQQKTRNGHTWESAPEYLHPRKKFIISKYGNRAEFYPYIRSSMKSADVVTDFAYHIGIDHDPADTLRSNQGISLEAAAILYTHAVHGPIDRSDGWYWRRNELAKIVSNIGKRKVRFSNCLIRTFAPSIAKDNVAYAELFGSTPEPPDDSEATLFKFDDLYKIAAESECELIDVVSARASKTSTGESLFSDASLAIKREPDHRKRIVQLVEVGLKIVWAERVQMNSEKKAQRKRDDSKQIGSKFAASPFLIANILGTETMATNEKRELMIELRAIKEKRMELNKRLKDIRDQKQLLKNEREELIKRANTLGMNIGKNATTTS